jgi:hypothetical protein
LVREVLNRLNREYAAPGKRATFQALKASLDSIDTKNLPSNEEAAALLKVSVASATVKTLIYRLRKEYTAFVRETISCTVSNSADVDSQIHQLLEVLITAKDWIVP